MEWGKIEQVIFIRSMLLTYQERGLFRLDKDLEKQRKRNIKVKSESYEPFDPESYIVKLTEIISDYVLGEPLEDINVKWKDVRKDLVKYLHTDRVLPDELIIPIPVYCPRCGIRASIPFKNKIPDCGLCASGEFWVDSKGIIHKSHEYEKEKNKKKVKMKLKG